MPRMGSMTISGIEPFRRKMRKLPEKIQKRVVKKAITRAGAVVRMATRKLVKRKAIDDGMPNGHLYEQIISKTKMVKGVPVCTVGSEYTSVSIAHLVYAGTSPHEIPVPWRADPLQHPGSKPFPFMQLGLEQSRGKAQSEMVARLSREIAKELKKK